MGDNKKFPTEVLFGTGPILDHQEVEEIYLAACDHVNSLKESMNDERLGTIRIPLFCRGFNEKLKNFNMKKSYIRSKYIETIEQKYKTVQEQKVLKKIQMLIKKAKARKNSPTRILASIITNITKTENQDKARDEFIKNLENLKKQYKQISAEDAVLLLEVDEEKTASSSGQVTSILEKLSEQKYKKEHEQKYKTVLEHIARPKSKQANKDLSGYGREAEKQQDAAVERLKDRRNKKNESTGVGPRITPDKGGR